MNILGMGTFEILVVLLIAFVFLGPQRMIEAARMMGKASRELRRMTDEIPRMVMEDDVTQKGRPNPNARPHSDAQSATREVEKDVLPRPPNTEDGPEDKEPKR